MKGEVKFLMQTLLYKSQDQVTLFLYKELLKKNKIPFEIKNKHTIYVDESCYDQAFAITSVIRKEQAEKAENQRWNDHKKRLLAIWISVLFIGVPLLYLVYHNFLR